MGAHEATTTTIGPEPQDFLLHEVLHCAMGALVSMARRKPKELGQAEEMLVQDICGVYLDLLNGKDDGSDDLRKM